MTEFATEHAPHIEDIARALNDKLDHPTIADELRKYVEDYNIDLATAKEAIVRKHYGDPRALARSVTKTLDQLTSPENSVSFRAKLVSLREKQITGRDGAERKIHEGYVADATGQLRFTSWHEDFPFEAGSVIEVSNAYTKEWNSNIDINLGDRCRVREVEDEALAALEVEQLRATSGGTGGGGGSATSIIELRDGMRSVNLTVRVLRVEPREVTVRGDKRTIYGGEVADETGSVRFTDWQGHSLEEGKSYLLANGYVREWQGTPELQLSEYSTVTTAEEAGLPPREVLDVGTPYTIEQLDERGGANDAVLEGHVLVVREGSGLIFRCPECNRALRNSQCMVHGKQNGTPDLRAKLLFDDGTGTVSLFLNRALTEELLGRDLDSCLTQVRESYTPEVVTDELDQMLLLRPLRVRGYTKRDDYGMMFFARECGISEAGEVPDMARQFLAALEA